MPRFTAARAHDRSRALVRGVRTRAATQTTIQKSPSDEVDRLRRAHRATSWSSATATKYAGRRGPVHVEDVGDRAAVRRCRAGPEEPEVVVEPGDQRVLLGRDVLADDPVVAELAARSRTTAKRDCSTVRPITRQLISQVSTRTAFGSSSSGTAISTATSPWSPNRSRTRTVMPIDRGPAEQAEDVLAGVAAGGQVELVRLGQELDDPRQVRLVDRPDVGRHLQRAEVVVDRRERLLELAPLAARRRTARSRSRSASVRPAVSNQRPGLEAPDELGGLLGHVDDLDLGQGLADLLALGRVVVEEDEAVEAEVERLGDPARSSPPSAPSSISKAAMSSSFRMHVGVDLERLAGVGRVVLRGDGQHDAARRPAP